MEEIRALQAFQISADFRIIPVLRADDLAADEALAVDDVSLRPAIGVVKLRRGLGRIADRNQVYMMADDKAAIIVRVFVDADSEDNDVGTVVVQLEQ